MNKDQQLLAEAYCSIYQHEQVDENLKGALAAGILGAMSLFGGNVQAQTPAQQPVAQQNQQIDAQTQQVLNILTNYSQKASKLKNDYDTAYKNIKVNTNDSRAAMQSFKDREQLTNNYKQTIRELRKDLQKAFNTDDTKIENLISSAIDYSPEHYKSLADLSLATGNKEELNKWADTRIKDTDQYLQQTTGNLKQELSK
jgi:DNA-binding ferritin-like protein (Dps family)